MKKSSEFCWMQLQAGAALQLRAEAIVLPMTHKERFENIGIQPPKGAAWTTWT